MFYHFDRTRVAGQSESKSFLVEGNNGGMTTTGSLAVPVNQNVLNWQHLTSSR
jgi:hypothetical protein